LELRSIIARYLAWLPRNLRTCISKLLEQIRRYLVAAPANPACFFLEVVLTRRSSSTITMRRLRVPSSRHHLKKQPFCFGTMMVSARESRSVAGAGTKSSSFVPVIARFRWDGLNRAIARFCGFGGYEEGELFASLAPHGNPKYADLIRTKIIELHGDGSFSLSRSFFHPSGEPEAIL
jgi:hypothetical protein